MSAAAAGSPIVVNDGRPADSLFAAAFAQLLGKLGSAAAIGVDSWQPTSRCLTEPLGECLVHSPSKSERDVQAQPRL
jgi:hypothetical protein